MSFVQSIHDSAYANLVRDSDWLYPMFQSIHIVGIALLVGSVAMTDLRLLGLSRQLPVTLTARHFLPVSWFGFVLIALTGSNMLVSYIGVFAVNPVFWIKMSMILIAGLNAAFFHLRVYRHVIDWDRNVDTPRAAKICAVTSLTLWIGVISAGKLLAYIGGKD